MENNIIKNKIAVVTGSAGGIGKALIQKLTDNGVFCIMIDRHTEPVEDLVRHIKQKQGDYYSADLTNTKEIDKTCDEISKKYDKIDFLYNVAGIGVYKELEDLTIEEWNNSINLNLTAPFYLTKRLLPLLTVSDTPLVFNIGSGMGVYAVGGRAAYCSSKFGLRGLTLSLAKEFKTKKIKFQIITLGSVLTDFGPGGIAYRENLKKTGKKYLNPETVSDKIIEMTMDRSSPVEVEMYPEGYVEENK